MVKNRVKGLLSKDIENCLNVAPCFDVFEKLCFPKSLSKKKKNTLIMLKVTEPSLANAHVDAKKVQSIMYAAGRPWIFISFILQPHSIHPTVQPDRKDHINHSASNVHLRFFKSTK